MGLSFATIDLGKIFSGLGSTAKDIRTALTAVSYTHLRAHETPEHLVCRLLLEKKTPFVCYRLPYS